MTSEHAVYGSLPADPLLVGEIDITPQEAELLGWLLGDGHIKRSPLTGRTSQSGGKKRGFDASIFQSKPIGVARLDVLLSDIPHGRRVRPKTGIVHFHLKPPYMRELWARYRLDDISLEQFVLSLDNKQRKAFLDGVYGAEGHIDSLGVRCISQNEGHLLEAVRLAIFLEGQMPWVSKKNSPYIYKDIAKKTICWVTRYGVDTRLGGQVLQEESLPKEP